MPELSPERIAEIKATMLAATPIVWTVSWTENDTLYRRTLDSESDAIDWAARAQLHGAAIDPLYFPACDPPTVIALIAMVERYRDALTFYADSEIYLPRTHGPSFNRSDLSYRAKAALSPTGDT